MWERDLVLASESTVYQGSTGKGAKSQSFFATKIALVKALLWPVATCGSESWTIKKDEKARFNEQIISCMAVLS